MTKSGYIFGIAFMLIMFTVTTGCERQEKEAGVPMPEQGIVYVIEATDALVTREVTGEAMNSVMGVPAEPVDAFTYDGKGVTAVTGSVYAVLDPVSNTGTMNIEWEDQYGEWQINQVTFSAPPMPLGLRFQGSATELVPVTGDAIVTNVTMHGDSGAVDATLPALHAYIGVWGVARVALNGELFANPYDGPAPDWLFHAMLVSGVYNKEGQVTKSQGGIYNPSNPGDGYTDFSDLEFQFIFLDQPGPQITSNYPPPMSFAYHMVFETVTLTIKQRGR